MTLSQRITELAQALARELKAHTTSEHGGVARAWVSFTDTGGAHTQPRALASHNVAGVERIARGRYQVNFAVAMADANYCWLGQATHRCWWAWFKPGKAHLQLTAKTPDFLQIRCRSAFGLPVAALEVNLTVWR